MVTQTERPILDVFDSCSVQAASDAASSLTGEVNLGRPWRQYATVVFKYCYLSDIISPVGKSIPGQLNGVQLIAIVRRLDSMVPCYPQHVSQLLPSARIDLHVDLDIVRMCS